jgi:hypothetical protein
MTHSAKEAAIRDSLDAMKSLKDFRQVVNLIRVEA